VENYGLPFRLPDLGPIGANGLANPRDFETPVAWFEDATTKPRSSRNRSAICGRPRSTIRRSTSSRGTAITRLGATIFPASTPSTRSASTIPIRRSFTVLTSPSNVPGRANVDFVIFPPRWMVAEDTFRPPWFHRNVMSEAMGLIYGEYDAKAEGFAPGGLSLHNLMSGHGPDLDSWRKASEAELKPAKIVGTLAFMVETCWPYRPTRFALERAQSDYDLAWAGFPKAVAVSSLDETHDPSLVSWVAGARSGTDFPIQNLPLGIFSEAKGRRRPGVAIGDYILDLADLRDLLDEEWRKDLSQPVLNAWLSRGSAAHLALRQRLSELLSTSAIATISSRG
jgi:hypothetical protein